MAEQILLIDDDLEHAYALKTYLERVQYDVTVASDTKDALLHLYHSAWDIILANPQIDEEVAESIDTLSEVHPLSQVIVFGNPAQIDTAMDRYGLSVIHYLGLPINSKELELALERARKNILQSKKIDRYLERLGDLHNAQNQFNQLFDEVPCYISVQDRNLRVTASNKRFKQHFGNVIGGQCFEIYKHRNTPCEKCPVIETFNDGKVHSTEEIVTSKSGKQYNVLTHTAPIKNEQGEITQVMEMSTNITQIRQLQDHLTSLGLMLGSMSHGVKGMLTALDGGIYQLETGLKQADGTRVNKAFGQVKVMTDKIKKMVLEILYYAKSRELQYTTMTVETLADNIIRNIKPMAERNNVKFEIKIPDSLGHIEIDPSWMEAALINFLENAVDACSFDRDKQDHRVTFEILPKDKGNLCFTIEDNGIGMDKETRDKMFTLFFTSKGSQGTGLGLFIANRVIEQHGGSVKVKSEMKQGTTFRIRLPRKRPGNFKNNGFPVAPR
ncbi:MAG: PAS domain-containing protein [Desulfobacteraceae bacterium]|nr:MAG: PAS domain-containing protein [Desulfobacteraceae bacterium]